MSFPMSPSLTLKLRGQIEARVSNSDVEPGRLEGVVAAHSACSGAASRPVFSASPCWAEVDLAPAR